MNTGSDIYARLKADHASVASLLQRLTDTDATDTVTRQTLFGELQHHLTGHSEAENAVFYAELLKHDTTRSLVRDGQREHQRIESLLDELDRMNTGNPQWGKRLQTLRGIVEHHVRDEEHQIIPAAQNFLTAQQATELGRRFAQARGHETVSQTPHAAASAAAGAAAGAQHTGARVSQEARELAAEARERGSSILRSQQSFVASQIEHVAGALHKTSQQLSSEEQEALARYTDQAAEGLQRFSHSLRDQDFNTLIGQIEDFARRQPAVFIGSAALLGFLATRFLKSSAERRHASASYPEPHGETAPRASTTPQTPSSSSPAPATSAPAPSPAPGATAGTGTRRDRQSSTTHGGN